MSELNKNQLKQDNQNSFPNNNTGYITPTILRDFNTNMIDSLVDEIGYNADSASFNARINALDPSGSAAALIALEQSTASLNAFTASQFVTNSLFSGQIGALQSWSSSLDTTYATDAQLSASASTLQNDINTRLTTASFNSYTASVSLGGYVTTSSFNNYTASASTNTSASINAATQSLSSSVAAINASQLSTASFNTYTASAATNTSASINSATSSLSQSLSASIGALSASAAATDAGQVSSASFNSYTASASTNVSASINAATSSLSSSLTLTDNSKLNSASFNLFTASALLTSSGWASTGSNTFIGNQIVSGNVDITGTITATSASFQYVKTVYETASIIFSSGSNQLGDELSDTQTLSGSVKVQGSLTVNGTSVITSSTDVSMFLSKSVFDTYTGSAATNVSGAINSATSSLSASLTTTIDGISSKTGSYITSAQTASMSVLSSSYAVSSSFANNALTASFLSGSIASASYALSSSFALTASEARNVVIIARNGNPSSLPAGTIVHITSASGDNPIFNTASYDSELLSANTLGMLRTTATSGADVEVLVNGIVTGVDTNPANGFVAGDILYLGPTGSFTRVQPQAPLQIVTIGQVLRAQQNNGSIYVNITNGWELNELHNVAINGAVDGDLLVYRSGSYGLWTNSSSVELGLVNSSSFNSYTSSAATNVSGAINNATSSLSQSLSASIGSLSASIAVTTNNNTLLANQKLDTGSFNTYTASAANNVSGAINSATQSLSSSVAAINAQQLTTASVAGNVITFTKGNGSTFPITVDTGSGGSVPAGTVSSSAQIAGFGYAVTASNTFIGNQDVVGIVQASDSNIGPQYSAPTVFQGVGSTAVAYDQFVNAGNYDALHIQSNQNAGTDFQDYNGSGLSTWLNIGTLGGRVAFKRNVDISGSTTLNSGNPSGLALQVITGSVEFVSTQGTGYFYSNLPITSSNGRINGTFIAKDLIVSGTFGGSGSGSLSVEGRATISSSLVVSGAVAITGSAPTQQWVSGGLTLSGSLLTNATDIYTGSNNANFVVTLGSASMASLLAGGTTNPNTLYFVLS